MLLLRFYISENPFTIRTHHGSLEWPRRLSNSKNCLTRWRFCLFEFDFDVVHRAGAKRQATEALSCLTTTNPDKLLLECSLFLSVIEALTASSVLVINYVGSHKCGSLHHDRWIVATPTPTAHDDSSMPPNIPVVLKEGSSGQFCKVTFYSVKNPYSKITVAWHGLMICFSFNHGSIQTVVMHSHRRRVL